MRASWRSSLQVLITPKVTVVTSRFCTTSERFFSLSGDSSSSSASSPGSRKGKLEIMTSKLAVQKIIENIETQLNPVIMMKNKEERSKESNEKKKEEVCKEQTEENQVQVPNQVQHLLMTNESA